ncbi:MAG TPA: saccharopine dehydrogenase NADP-binding domain-containing protein, partial [Polyangiales bacterium]|nr:saccharopine dehydrogenase NADP-binding domain-containing protein [Polyangiales bacterium]
MKKNVLVIGTGAVGAVVAHKCAQNSGAFASVCLSSRNVASCEALLHAIESKGYRYEQPFRLQTAAVDAYDTASVVRLIEQTESDLVINVCTAFVNMSVMEACLATGAVYLDTAVHEDYDVMNAPYPWYANHEWKKRDDFAAKGLTAILGVGFDPGVVNAYCEYAQRHEFDNITSIDILDVNDGKHGRFFSTNFDPEINLREVIEDAGCLEDGEWRTYPRHSRSMDYDFPVVGSKRLYLMGHDEVHSLSVNIRGVKSVRFWMGFDDHYLNCLNVFEKVGLLNHQKVTTSDGQGVVPLHVLKACLPNPMSLAATYSGQTCIGVLIRGKHQNKDKE